MNISRLKYELEQQGLSLPAHVVKRDGSVQEFDISRVEKAVTKCFNSLPELDYMHSHPEAITRAIAFALSAKLDGSPSVELVQNMVELTLLTHGEVKAASAYMHYRDEHAKMRGQEVPDEIRAAFEADKVNFPTQFSQFNYYDKYSRFNWELGRRETWEETVDRTVVHLKWEVTEHTDGLQVIPEDVWEDIRTGILRMEIMPSMRLLAMAGPAAQRNSMSVYNCSFIPGSDAEAFVEALLISMAGCGVGFSVERRFVEQLPRVVRQTGQVPSVHVVADSAEGWGEALRAGLRAWWAGTDLSYDYSAVRPKGAVLVTKGGRASGPGPLKKMLELVRKTILARQGTFLRTIDVHDNFCFVAEGAVAGGVRRAAMLSLFDYDDELMRNCKNEAQWWLTNPQRKNANNSAVWPDDISDMQIMAQMTEMMFGHSGEPGIFSRAVAYKTMPDRRRAFGENIPYGVNPCVPADTWVQTSEGPRRVKDLVGVPFTAVVNGKNYDLESVGFFPTGVKQLLKVKTADGRSMRLTADHKVLVERKTGRTRRAGTVEFPEAREAIFEQRWVPAGELVAGERIVLHKHADLTWNGRGSGIEGYAIGNLIGDGTFSAKMAFVQNHTTEQGSELIRERLQEFMKSMPHRSDFDGWFKTQNDLMWRMGTAAFTALASSYGVVRSSKTSTDEIEMASSDFAVGFLRGLFDTDGHVEGSMEKSVSVRLSNSDLPLLEAVQRMLTRLGMTSSIAGSHKAGREMPGGYESKRDCYRLILSGKDADTFMRRIGFWNTVKQAKWETFTEARKESYNKQSPAVVVSVEFDAIEPVYDVTVSEVHAFDANGYYIHNCGEIFLRPYGLCNLSQAICREDDTVETLTEKVTLATIIGTIQSLSTRFPGLRDEWKINAEEERLLGVDLTAQNDSPLTRVNDSVGIELRKKLYKQAVMVNEIYAEKLGINPSASVTCNKPAGNSTGFIGASGSGIHKAYAPFYVRRARISADSPVLRVLKEAGAPVEPDVMSPTQWVVEFPLKSPEGSKYGSETSAIEQLEFWLLNKRHWTSHNPSCTVEYNITEVAQLTAWVCEHKDEISGVSFLPRNMSVYPQMPFEAITQDEYERRVAEFPDIDWSLIYAFERTDMTTAATTLACFSGQCEV